MQRNKHRVSLKDPAQASVERIGISVVYQPGNNQRHDIEYVKRSTSVIYYAKAWRRARKALCLFMVYSGIPKIHGR
ncbi:hypothetical protein OIDMADRAFT_18505 [Oidiodendron maius Zn]|uniref:Uncharacterized protein n=1 Tax=Oidiodendron maius (strain Zn) TaxID=913774 RepID=A0A0C3HL06_OIDMZ|nr:hypothetical protein OIDMADRAFT_18505 [Oidiodendron maius Zn]